MKTIIRSRTTACSEEKVTITVRRVNKFTVGVLVRADSFWVGAHWSPYNKRLCINFIPFVTVWFALPEGVLP